MPIHRSGSTNVGSCHRGSQPSRSRSSKHSSPPPAAAARLSRRLTTTGRRAVRKVHIASVHALPHNAAARGLQVSLRHVAQDLLLQSKFSHEPLQPAVFSFQFLQPLRWIELEPAKLLPPAIVRLCGDPRIPAGLRGGFPVGNLHLHLSQQVHNLLRLKPLRGDDRSYSSGFSLTSLGTKEVAHLNPPRILCGAHPKESPWKTKISQAASHNFFRHIRAMRIAGFEGVGCFRRCREEACGV